MFDISDSALDREKCYTTIGQLPRFIDPKQQPTKKSPFSAISGHPFIHSTELLLPEEIYLATWDAITKKVGSSHYAKVFLSLSDILDGEFFNAYIKVGNILLISEGMPGVDNVYSLKDGVLKLELDKSSYERAGLVGKPVRSGGKKHVTSRYVVEMNLRLPSMLHGKKGFERIVWAFKNVLNESVAWLFCDLSSSAVSDKDTPIQKHSPQNFSHGPTKTILQNVLSPPLTSSLFTTETNQELSNLRDTCFEVQEWLALAALESPRVCVNDSIDPYLSRYALPDREHCTALNLVKLTWRGLIPNQWIGQLFVATLRSTAKSNFWFAVTSHALGKEAVDGKDGYTILALPCEQTELASNEASEPNQTNRKFVCWEYVC